jgi:hypothetical protein
VGVGVGVVGWIGVVWLCILLLSIMLVLIGIGVAWFVDLELYWVFVLGCFVVGVLF